MSLHDDYARVTPLEIAFYDTARASAFLAGVLEEAARRGVDPTELDGFLSLSTVGEYLTGLHGAEAPRVALLEYGTLTFHAVHSLRAGTPLFLLTTSAARGLVEAVPTAAPVAEGAAPAPPTTAGYLQLPQHLFWARLEGAAPESVDGAFWTVSAAGRLHVLPITGVRPERPGFGTLAVPDAPLAHAAEWVHATVREGGEDYASDLPGADIDRLYAIRSVGEILKLMARFFVHAAEVTGRPEPPRAAPTRGGPAPSALPFVRIEGSG
jgi:hypothetical protein